MNEDKLSQANWERFTREELLAELSRLQAEVARLTALLPAMPPAQAKAVLVTRNEPSPAVRNTDTPVLSPQQKVQLFWRLFRGRTDVYPLRWESRNSGKSGYSLACANEWRAGICDKPRIRCADCGLRVLLALDDQVIYAHLAGDHTVGLYSLMQDGTCYLLAVDFDEEGWREDAMAFRQSCEELEVPVSLEISRSGNGTHAWIFFSSAVAARDARKLGSAIISHTCARTRQLELSSYDRLFPNQDVLPKGGFGNLICYAGEPLVASFAGTLRDDQQTAVADLLRHDTGILHAPTAFGKTVTAAAMIAQRGVNTLVLARACAPPGTA